MTRVRIIGPGRAGRALALALERAGWPVEPILGRGDDLTGAAQGVDLLVLAVPDGAVAEVARVVAPVPTTVVAHLAGALGLDVLAPHRRRAAVHPLVALPDPELGADRLTGGAWFAVAGEPIAVAVVDALGGRTIQVRDEARGAYHAAACVAANHLVALLGQVERVAAGAGVPLEAFVDLARGALDNVAALGPVAALTGPVARGDWETVKRHLAALDPPERAAYQALAEAAARLAGRQLPDQSRVSREGLVEIDTIEGFRKALEAEREAGRTVGLVPTMGYLHEGHVSLMRRAAVECDVVAATIFVNPLQFAPTEDLEAYPRDLDRDRRLASEAGVSYLFTPRTEEMYPEPVLTTVTVAEVSDGLEGASRPAHFAGVATVVAKLFNIAGPCRAYFGEKDWQQLQVVRRMVRDLSFPVEVVGCPTVREPDGLALSSRNVYLSPPDRAAATVLHRALLAGAADPANAEKVMTEIFATEPLVELDYAEVVETDDEYRLLVAARVGPTRLIDNLGVTK